MLYLIFGGLVLLVGLDLYTLIRKYIPLERENAELNGRISIIEDSLVKGLATHGNRLAVRVEAIENAFTGQRRTNVEIGDSVYNLKQEMETWRKIVVKSLEEIAVSLETDQKDLTSEIEEIKKKIAKKSHKVKKLTKGKVSKK
jgi:hypothetical protein